MKEGRELDNWLGFVERLSWQHQAAQHRVILCPSPDRPLCYLLHQGKFKVALPGWGQPTVRAARNCPRMSKQRKAGRGKADGGAGKGGVGQGQEPRGRCREGGLVREAAALSGVREEPLR